MRIFSAEYSTEGTSAPARCEVAHGSFEQGCGMIEAVIFDLDGVLVDAAEWHYEALNKALGTFGFTISRKEHLSFYNGLPTRKKLEALSAHKGFPSALHKPVISLKQRYTYETICARCRPDPAKIEMLELLRKSGFTLAVCSNAVNRSVELMLKKSGIFDCFSLVLGNEDVRLPKPDPEIYFRAFQLLKLSPEQCAIVEDSDHGKAAARASGGFLIGVDSYNEVNKSLFTEFLSGELMEGMEECRSTL